MTAHALRALGVWWEQIAPNHDEFYQEFFMDRELPYNSLPEKIERGLAHLSRTQRPDGSWTEEYYTGTGFPRVFYLKYHLYSQYFPLMALGQYQRESEKRFGTGAKNGV